MRGVIGEVEEKLRAHEYKMTPKREHVLCVLLENKDKHLSAEEVYNLVKKRSLMLDWLRFIARWSFFQLRYHTKHGFWRRSQTL